MLLEVDTAIHRTEERLRGCMKCKTARRKFKGAGWKLQGRKTDGWEFARASMSAPGDLA
jgi:hypothetical protein